MNRLFTLSIASLMLMIVSCGKADTSAIEARLDAVEKVSIASLQSQMSQINTTIGNLQATQSQLSGFVTNLQTSVGTLEGNYSSLNTAVDNLGKQNSKFEKDIADLAKAVDDCGKDVKKWVEESYTTLTKFSELQGEVSTIKTNIQTIFSRLDSLDSETKRISDGLRDLSTELNEKLGKCEGEIEGIKKDLKALQDDMDLVKAQIAAIVSSVQSVVVVPDYSDGSVKMTNSAENLIRFEVYPLEAASKLASLGASAVSLDYVETATKAGALSNIAVSKISFDGEFFTVTADGSTLPSNIQTGEGGANARLRISDGTITRSSEYFRLTFEKAQSESSDVIIELLPLSGLTEMHATLNAKVGFTAAANDDVFYGFVYSESKDNLFFNREFYPLADTLKTRTVSKDGVLSCTTHNLKGETKYYYRPFVMKNDVAYYGDAAEFTTLAVDCTVETLEATDVSDSKARLNGKLTVNSQENLAKEYIGFLYSKTATTLEEFKSSGGTFVAAELKNDGTFKSEQKLDYNTMYYFVAVATVHNKAFYGEVKTFTTDVVPVESVSLDKTEYTFNTIGNTLTLKATVLPADATDKSVIWTSDKEAVATVDANGRVTAKGNGKATITVTTKDQGKTASCEITVAQWVTGISFDKTSITLVIGAEATLSVASVLPYNANDKTFTWSSSDSAIASVDNSGKVTARASGTATIRATANDGSGVFASCSVVVFAEKVDLGIKTSDGKTLYWSTRNLCESGFVNSPEEYGDYYAWGETAPYYSSQSPLTWKNGKSAGYDWASYKWSNGSSSTLTKYNTKSSYGLVDNTTVLESVDDVASVKLGGKWRMPTDAEWTELRKQCTWTWTTNYNGTGVKGRIVTATNGNSIFLPAAGSRDGTNLGSAGSRGYYWSSSLSTDSPSIAWRVDFNSDNVNRYRIDRCRGFSVRPVSE